MAKPPELDLDVLNYQSQFDIDRAEAQAATDVQVFEDLLRNINGEIKSNPNAPRSLHDEAVELRRKINAYKQFRTDVKNVRGNLPPMPAGTTTAAEKEKGVRTTAAKTQVAANAYKLDDVFDLDPGQSRTLETLGRSGLMNQIRGLAPITPGVLQILGMTLNPLTLGMSPERLGAVFGAGSMKGGDPRKQPVMIGGKDSGVSQGQAVKDPSLLLPEVMRQQNVLPGTSSSAAGELAGNEAINLARGAGKNISSTPHMAGLGAGVKIGNLATYGTGGVLLANALLGDGEEQEIGADTPLTPEQRDWLMKNIEPYRDIATAGRREERMKTRKTSETNVAKAIHGRMHGNPLTTAFTKEDFDEAFPYDQRFDDRMRASGMTPDELADPSNSKKLGGLLKDMDKSQPILIARNNARAKIAVYDKSLEGGLGAWTLAEIPIGQKGMTLNYAKDKLDNQFDSSITTLKQYKENLEGAQGAIDSYNANKDKKKGKTTVR